MPVVVPSLWSTGSPPVQRKNSGLRACLNRGAVGVPSRMAKLPSFLRSSENVPSSAQCTQSMVPSAVRSTVDGTEAALIAMLPWKGGFVVGFVVGLADVGVSDGAGLVDGDGDGLPIGIGAGLPEG